jgi:plastocyanin
MTRTIAVGLALLALGLALQLVSGGPAAAATRDVAVGDNYFEDAVSAGAITTITAGDTVVWTWEGVLDHSVTADDNSFDSNPGSWQASGTYQFTFNTPGTYEYFCRVHSGPTVNLMNGTIIVQAAQEATSTPVLSTNTPAAATNTPAPSSTPDPDDTSTATNTPAAVGTAASATNNPITADPISAPAQPESPSGGAAGGGALPSAGSGGGTAGTNITRLAAIGFALIGATLVAGACGWRFLRRSI